MNRTGCRRNVQNREIAMLVFKQPLSQDSPEFLTSIISPCPPHYINTEIGTSPSKRNRTICPTVKIQRKTHIKSRWYFITMFQVSWSLSFLFHCLRRGGLSCPNTFSPLPPSRILPLTFAYLFPIFKPSSNSYMSNCISPFLQKVRT